VQTLGDRAAIPEIPAATSARVSGLRKGGLAPGRRARGLCLGCSGKTAIAIIKGEFYRYRECFEDTATPVRETFHNRRAGRSCRWIGRVSQSAALGQLCSAGRSASRRNSGRRVKNLYLSDRCRALHPVTPVAGNLHCLQPTLHPRFLPSFL
jgi:hypothetical protein